MFWNLTTTILVIAAALAFYWLWPKLAAVLKRFDDTNRARKEGQIRDRYDHLAHYRHALAVAEEQVEEIVEVVESDPRTATPVTRYVFEGVRYATRADAEDIRAQKIGDIAKGFYRDLPHALAARKGDGKLK